MSKCVIASLVGVAAALRSSAAVQPALQVEVASPPQAGPDDSIESLLKQQFNIDLDTQAKKRRFVKLLRCHFSKGEVEDDQEDFEEFEEREQTPRERALERWDPAIKKLKAAMRLGITSCLLQPAEEQDWVRFDFAVKEVLSAVRFNADESEVECIDVAKFAPIGPEHYHQENDLSDLVRLADSQQHAAAQNFAARFSQRFHNDASFTGIVEEVIQNQNDEVARFLCEKNEAGALFLYTPDAEKLQNYLAAQATDLKFDSQDCDAEPAPNSDRVLSLPKVYEDIE